MAIPNLEDSLPSSDVRSESISLPINPPSGSIGSDIPMEPTPPIEFMPFVDEAEEKRKFWVTVLITVGVFFVVSLLVVGFIISQRLSTPSDSKLSAQYIDTTTPTVQSTLPPRQQSKAPIITAITTPRPTAMPITRLPTSGTRPITIPVNRLSGTLTPTNVTTTTTITPTSLTTSPSLATTTTPSPTLLPTVTNTPSATPTPYLVTSVDSYSYGTVNAGSTVTNTFTLFNTGGSSLTITAILFASTGSNVPYSITTGGNCITDGSVPVSIGPGATKCINIQFAPSYTSTNTNTLQIYWNNPSIKSIPLSATVPTATPTNTLTPTP